MESYRVYGYINDICIIGHGCVGKGTLPLIKRHFQFDKITIIDPHPVEVPEVSEAVKFIRVAITQDNYKEILDKIFINKVGFCVNLTTGTSSSDMTQYCQAKGVFYVDASKEEWEGHYTNDDL
jgi:homospermidine synthase